jgi:cellulose synthase operon protein C
MGQGRLNDADDSIDAVLLAEPRNASALLAKAHTLIARNRIADAIPQARAAAEADPQNVQARYVLGKLFTEMNQPSPAIQAFNEVIQINPRAASAHVELAKLYLGVDDAKNSSRAADEALRSDPENPELRILLARGLLGAGGIRRAEPEIRSLLKTYPRSAAVHSLAGSMFLTQRDLLSAKKAFEQALQLDVDHREALAQLVNVYAETDNLGEAHRIIERRLAKPPPIPACSSSPPVPTRPQETSRMPKRS